MSDHNLRRSSRRSQKKQDKFSVGMIVEITRDRIQSTGRLVSKLTDDSSANPRWQVAFDEKSWPEEDMYESAFGKVIGKVTEELEQKPQPRRTGNAATGAKKPSPPPSPPTAPTNNNNNNNDHGSNHSAHKKKVANTPRVTSPRIQSTPPPTDSDDASSRNAKKRKSMDMEEEVAKSDDSAAMRKKAMDREARHRRRQAIVDEENGKTGKQNHHHHHHHVVAAAVAKKKGKEENVIRVPMLTGTLLLYRGPQRRAEFIYEK